MSPDIVAAAEALSNAAAATAHDLARGDISGEEDFTGQLLGRFKTSIEGLDRRESGISIEAYIQAAEHGEPRTAIRLSARQTGAKGKHSEESWSGADLLMVLDISTSDYEVQKGVLVQAKRLDAGQTMKQADATRLRQQCSAMLELTSSSFVFLYAPHGITTLSATLVEHSKRNDLHALEQWPQSTDIFFLDFVKCWHGDNRLNATNRETLAVLRSLTNARNALLLKIREP